MLVIDPMHNLFLGTAKKIIRLWTDGGVLSSKDFEYIQSTVDSMEVPAEEYPTKLKQDSPVLLQTNTKTGLFTILFWNFG